MLPKPPKDKKKTENHRRNNPTNCIVKSVKFFVENLILNQSEATKVFEAQQSTYIEIRWTTESFIVMAQHVNKAYQ